MRNRKKVGLLIDSIQVSKQINDLINLSVDSDNYEITTLIINSKKASPIYLFTKSINIIKKRGFKSFFSWLFFKSIYLLERKLVSHLKNFKNVFDKINLSERDFEIIKVNPVISESGFVYRYDEFDIKKIKEVNLDLVVRGGSGILRGDILTVCPNGVISFHHADNNINRGSPPGFWEVYNRQPKTGFIIQRLKDELDGGDVLFKGFIRTSLIYSLNLAKLLEISNPYFHKVLEDITSNSSIYNIQRKIPYGFPLYKTPNISQTLNYVCKTFNLLFLKVFRKLIGNYPRWGVAYQFTSTWEDVALWRSNKIPNPKNRFLADPFIIKRNNIHYCFVEDYDFLKRKGCISVYEINKDFSKEIGVALLEDFHISYPFLFVYEEELFMCPETKQKGEIRLYRCIEFPLKWEFYKTIMRDVNAVDSSIFYKDKKWWLLTNLSLESKYGFENQLNVFYSNSPLSDMWIPHEKNPVIFDPLKSRNGGLIVDENEIYRVYQRNGFNKYGEAFGVAKIAHLDSRSYVEKDLFEIEPNFFNSLIGTHTYNYVDGLIVFDYLKNQKIN